MHQTRTGVRPTNTGSVASSSPTTKATRYVDMTIVSANRTAFVPGRGPARARAARRTRAGALVGGLELGARRDLPAPLVPGQDGADLEVGGVEQNLPRGLAHRHRDRLLSGEGGRPEVGRERELVAARDD